MRFDRREMVESAVLGIAALIAFTIIAVLVAAIGLVIGSRSLVMGFRSEVILVRDFSLFFVLVAVIKILIGGRLIDWITRLMSVPLGVRILVDEKKKHA